VGAEHGVCPDHIPDWDAAHSSWRLVPRARTRLDELKDWLRVHNAAVMAVQFLVFGVDLIAKGIPPLT